MTTQEIETLKQNWVSDPCWDIETTEGFEDYYDELKRFRIEQEKKWKASRYTELQEKSQKWGIPGNLALTRAIEDIHNRLNRLSQKIESLTEDR